MVLDSAPFSEFLLWLGILAQLRQQMTWDWLPYGIAVHGTKPRADTVKL